MSAPLEETVLADTHREMGAKMVDFGGWNMPIHYGSQLQEHREVRNAAGMFDVSHMTVVDILGADAQAFLRYTLANDVARLKEQGKALYSGMLNEAGGVIDDLIVYLLEDRYRLVVNCATREKDLAWLAAQASGFDVDIVERADFAMIAVQGPKALEAVHNVIPEARGLRELSVFQGASVHVDGHEWFVARTGYTGEQGYEVILPNSAAVSFWASLREQGVTACGLGARDTLRLEAGMNLYGHEMDETVSPLVANMAWTVALEPEDRDFIGRKALEAEKARGVSEQLVGLVFRGKGVLRAGQTVESTSGGVGVITSGSVSPTLGVSVALARVPKSFGEQAQVAVRNKMLDVDVVKPCFVRNGLKAF